jgi:putative ABC transport system permease protein
MPGELASTTTNYISEVSSATNFTVILQLMGIGILLTLVSSCAGIIFVLRYEPLKILTNRD